MLARGSSMRLVYVAVVVLLQQTASAAESDEAALLLHFKQANTGNPALASWASGSLPCSNSWAHIVCDLNTLTVVAVELSGLGLTGPVPPLQGLTSLARLDLSHNGFTGEVPSLPPSLRELLLSDNQLTGLGDTCSYFPAAQTGDSPVHVDVSSNLQLQGYLPDAWGPLQQLEELDLSNTAWQCTIVQDTNGQPTGILLPQSWSDMSGLRYLDLSASSGYADLVQLLPDNFYNNSYTQFVVWQNLETFKCHHCNWNAPTDWAWASLPNLLHLDISYNPVTIGPNDPLQTNAPGLEQFNQLPGVWQTMNLVVLKVRGCGLIPKDASSLANWTAQADGSGLIKTLRVLDLGDNTDLNFTNMEAVFAPMKLWELHIDNTAITSAASAPGWAHLPCVLDFQNNPVLIAQLGSQKRLTDTSSSQICRANATDEWTEFLNWKNTWNAWDPTSWTSATVPGGINPTCPNPPWESISCDDETGRITTFSSNPNSVFCEPEPCPIPREFFRKLSALNLFQVSRANIQARLSGPDALDMSESRLLVHLGLADNKLSGPLDDAWTEYMPNLKKLWLSGNNITGTLPDSWGNTQESPHLNLEDFQCRNCSLQGTLPAWGSNTCGQTSLQFLDLSHNNYIGTVPMSWTALSSLTMLYLGDNQLSGPIFGDSVVCDMALVALDVSNNACEGPLFGGGSTSGNFAQLISLNASFNRITWDNVPLSTQMPPKLSELYLDSNLLTGSLPSTLYPSITKLSLSGNSLNGSIPAAWAGSVTPHYFKLLDLSHNALTGVLPNWPGPVAEYGVVDMSWNKFSGPLPNAWADQAGITYQAIRLSHNQLTGTLPAHWSYMAWFVSEIDLSYNKLNGTFGDWFGIDTDPSLLPSQSIPNQITRFDLRSNPCLCGGVPDWIKSQLDPLTTTGGPGNTIYLLCNDPMQQQVCSLSLGLPPTVTNGTTPIDTTATNASDADVPGLLALKSALIGYPNVCAQSPQVCQIFDTWNRTNGLPCSKAYCTPCTLGNACGVQQYGLFTCNWKYLECNNGRVSRIVLDWSVVGGNGPTLQFSSLPAAISSISQLQELYLSYHTVGGSLPPELGLLTNLRVLTLSGNGAMSGTLPSQWSTLVNLQVLQLGAMSGVSGTFPSSWRNLTSIQRLSLAAMNISGPLPTGWSLPLVEEVRLHDLGQLLVSTNINSWLTSPSLRVLSIDNVGGMKNASLPANLFSFYSNLTQLSLSGQGLTGSIPDTWQTILKQNQLLMLNLRNNALNGTLPAWLASRLSTSAMLDLSFNQLTGPLPAAWGQGNTSLQMVRLNMNKLSGLIPPEWGHFAYNTGMLDLSDNQLQGSLDPSWYNTSSFMPGNGRLYSFTASNNPCLCGGFPSWIPYGYAATSTSASASTAAAPGPPADPSTSTPNMTYTMLDSIFRQCTDLDVQQACAQSSRTFPPEFYQDVDQLLTLAWSADGQPRQRLSTWHPAVPPCTNLINSSSCVMCDDYSPDSICGTMLPNGTRYCNWRHVECRSRRVISINMAGKGMKFGGLSSNLANGTLLEKFDISGGSQVYGGILPVEFGNWVNMTIFRLQGYVGDSLPLSYTAWSRIRVFELFNTVLNGIIPAAYFDAWHSLEVFTIDGAQLGGYLPAPWGCPNLTMYVVQNTPVISDSNAPVWVITPQAGSLTRIQAIGLGGTEVQLPSWTTVKQALKSTNWPLSMLSLPGLNLTGQIGPLKYYLPQLRMMDLANNSLSGVLPPDMLGYTNLAYLNLANNSIHGTLPADLFRIFALSSPSQLDLSNNRLSGPLPALTYTTPPFRTLSIGWNQLEGSLPESWSSLMLSSTSFDARMLRLSGTLPATFMNAASYKPAGTQLDNNWQAGIELDNNTCLCGPLPSWYDATGDNSITFGSTGLGLDCSTCSYPAVQQPTHPDWPGLQSFQAAIVGGPPAATSALNATWSANMYGTPCLDIDPNCQPCLFYQPSALCGSLMLSGTGPPAYYCNAQGVACNEGRVSAVNVSWSGLVLSQLPSGLSQLPKLQELGLEGVTLSTFPNASLWDSLPGLTTLRLSGNTPAIFDRLPASSTLYPHVFSNLQTLAISNAIFADGGVPDSWKLNPNLQSLTLHNVTFLGQGPFVLPASWGSMTNLTSLRLDTVKGLSGIMPATWVAGFANLTSFKLRYLKGVNVTYANMVDFLNQTSRLPAAGKPGMQAIAFSGLNLTGTLPAVLFQHSGLTELSLADNQLSGNLSLYTSYNCSWTMSPCSWTVLRSLRHIDLSRNSFTGSLPSEWSALRNSVTIDVSYNNLAGSLPAVWSLAGADGQTLPLTYLDVSYNSLTGTLPASWKNFPPSPATYMNVSHNQLSGGIPDAWGNRSSSAYSNYAMWEQVDVSVNPQMCGVLPSWWYSRFGANTYTLVQGTQLSTVCRPATFSNYFTPIGAYYPRAGRPVQLQLISQTPFPTATTASPWRVDLSYPATSTVVQSSDYLQQWKVVGTDYYWTLAFGGQWLQKVGSYKFSVSNTLNATISVTNRETIVSVFPAISLADTSSMSAAMTNMAVGATATVTMWLNDYSGNAILTPSVTTTIISNGTISGQHSVTNGSFNLVSPGVYTYNHTATALEQLNFTVYIAGSAITCYKSPYCKNNTVVLNITTVLPSAVDPVATADGAQLQAAGDTFRSTWNATTAPLVVSAGPWHLLYLPVIRDGGGVFYKNPGFYVQLLLAVTNTTAVNGTSSSNMAAAVSSTTSTNSTTTSAPLNFTGYWSTSNGSYVVAFKLPTSGVWLGQVDLKQYNYSTTSIVTKAVSLNASNVFASAAQSYFYVSGTFKIGDYLNVMATLKSTRGILANKADNVTVQVTGSLTGAIQPGPILRQSDGTWMAQFVPIKEETLTIQLVISTLSAGSQTVVIAGRSAAYMDYNTSLQQATLQAQALAVTSVITEGSLLLAYTNESSFVSVPVIDKSGSIVTADPGLRAVLSLLPPPNDTALLRKYNLSQTNTSSPATTASGSSKARRRALLGDHDIDSLTDAVNLHSHGGSLQLQQQELQAEADNDHQTGTVLAMTRHLLATSIATSPSPVPSPIPSPGPSTVFYMSDYSVEAPDPSSFDAAPPIPSVSNTSNATSSNATAASSTTTPTVSTNATAAAGSGMGPDPGNPVQDNLTNEAGVATFRGLFDPVQSAYSIQLIPPTATTYTAVLSLRHPNLNGSFVVRRFQLAVNPNPTLLAAAAAVNTTANTTPAATAASIALFNPLSNPRLDFVATFSRISAATYPGGNASVLSTFQSVVAANAVLSGANWVIASIVAMAPLRINSTVWFPTNYLNFTSPFQGVSAMDYYAFLLNTLPTVAFSNDLYPAFVATNVKVDNFTVTLAGAGPVSGSTYSSTAAGASNSLSGTTSAASGANLSSLSVVNVATSDLAVVVTQSTASAALPPPVDLSKIVDKTPPVITLIGAAYMALLQADTFSDPGATAYDNVDGNGVSVITRLQLCVRPTGIETAVATDSRALTCGSSLAAVNTTLPSKTNETYVLTYNARDAAGNQAVPLRRYVVINSRCPSPEKWCASLSTCSVKGLCLATVSTGSSSSSGSKAAAAVYVPPPDKTPPQLQLLGSGQAAITATGAPIMMDNVTWRSIWVDPGASAFDAVDGNLTANIQSYGAGAVDTSLPTAQGKDFSYVIEYAVSDKSGNAAPVARRLIRIVCPTGESFCVDPDTGKATCTVNGVCGAPTLLAVPTAATSSAPSAASTASASKAAAAVAVATPPRLSLLVPGPVQITSIQGYDRCADDAAVGAVCEQGVSADDTKDGNLDRQVFLCGNRWKPPSNQKAVPVLLACAVDLNTPGDYNLTFSVTNSAGLTSTVSRKITVKAVCPQGESLCSDQVTCSVSGSCVSLSPSTTGTSGTTQTSKQASAAAASAPAKAAANQAPVVTLLTTSDFSDIVHVRRGTTYDLCKAGAAPTAAAPCEPGAVAVDPDGLIAVDSTVPQPLNKTSEVVVCPGSCLSRGCSPTELRRNFFVTKGLAGCGIDTTAAEGTQFTIDFWVWDNGSPALNATVSRTVVIDKPCPSASAPYYCTDATSGRTFCSGSPCAQALKLIPPAKPQPKIQLLPTSGPVYIQYSKPAALDVRPCSSGSQNVGCGAVAGQATTTQGKQDLTTYISISQTAQCDSSSTSCPSCDLAALLASGNCMPGTYVLTYTVANDDGASDTATRNLYVYQAVYLSATFGVYSGVVNDTVAQGIAQNLQNSSTSDFADASGWVLGNLTTALSARMTPSDVIFTTATPSQSASGDWNVNVTAKLYIYTPLGVHKGDVDGFQRSLSTGAAATAGRRLLAAADDSRAAPHRGQSAERLPSVVHALSPYKRSKDSFARTRRTPVQQTHVDTLEARMQQLQQGLRKLQAATASNHDCLSGQCPTATADAESMASASRRLLSQSTSSNNSIDALVAALADQITTSMGASGTSTTALTTQQIDVLQVYVSSLTSDVQQLQQGISSLSSGATSLSSNINLAFGDSELHVDADTQTQITTMYQDLVTEFDSLVSTINHLADVAVQKFDQQATAAATYAASVNDAVTSMRESASLAQALQQKYVEQTLMIDAATGQIVEDWTCDRGKYLNVHFTVNGSAVASNTSTSNTTGRRLLAATSLISNSGAGSSNSSAAYVDDSMTWEGYIVGLKESDANWAIDDTFIPEQARYIGANPGQNRVIGGLFMHTTRKTVDTSKECSGSTFQSKYDFRCRRSEVTLTKNATLLAEYLAILFAGDTNDVFPYGVDPVFLRSSAALYQPDLQGNEGWYYNTSDHLEVPPTTGTPYGFFHRPIKGYPDGFPVLLPTRTSAQRSAMALQYLADGNYLDQKSKRLTAELLTYNADLKVIGYTEMTFDWQTDGSITGFVNIRTVPALKTTAEGGSGQLAAWLVPVWVLCVAFWLTAVVEARQMLHHYDGDRWLQVLLSSGDCILNFAAALIMLLSVLLLMAYSIGTAPTVKPQAAYELYDSVTSSRARMFLPAKHYSAPAVAAAEAAYANSSQGLTAIFDGGDLPSEPGVAGRWVLPEAAGDWSEWAVLMQAVHLTVEVWSGYTCLQGLILVLLVLKLVRSWSFQSKLGIICNTITQAAPQLAHLIAIIMMCIVLFACMQTLVVGYRVDYVHTYAAAVEETFRTVLGLGFMDLTSVFPDGLYVSRIEAVMGVLLSYGRQLLFVFVLAQYFMATIGEVFIRLKQATAGAKGSSIGRDISRDVCPELRAKLSHLLKGRKYSTTARDRFGAAVEVPAGSEALQDFIKALYPHLISSKKFGDRVSALPVGAKYLDLETLQQMLTELAVLDDHSGGRVGSILTQQRRPAKAYQRQAEAVLAVVRRSGSNLDDAAPASKDPAEVAAPAVSNTEIEVAGAAAAVAAVLAAAEQLMSSLGKAVDANELTETRIQLSEAMEIVGVAQELRAGVDFTADGLQAVIERELELHRQIYSAIWSAVMAMERWSTGVNKWLARVTKDTNSWLATNAHIAAQNPSAAAKPYMGYVPIPLPAQVDLRQTRTTLELPDSQSLQLQQQADEAKQLASAAAVRAGSGTVRLGADLGTAAVDSEAQSTAAVSPQLLGIANQWVSSSGVAISGGSISSGQRWGNNARLASTGGVALDFQRLRDGDVQAPGIGWQRLTSLSGSPTVRDVPQSPGGVSLHSRFAGQSPTPARQSGVMATLRGFLGGQGADSGSSTTVTEVTTARSPRPSDGYSSPRPSSGSRPRSGSRSSASRVAPLASASSGKSPALSPEPSPGAGSNRRSATVEDLGSSAATSSHVAGNQGGEVMPGSVAGDGDGVSARRESQADRLPTVTGRTPRNRLQPIE